MLNNTQKNNLSNDIIDLIYKHGEKIVCKKGDSIVTPNTKIENVYFIDNGRFKYVLTDISGNNIISKFDEKGTFIALIPIITEVESVPMNIIADIDSIIYKINKSTFNYILEISVEFRNYILKDLCNDVLKNSDHTHLLGLKSNKEKLYNYLLMHADYEQPSNGDWYNLKYNYKQQEIADFLGADRTTVWKVMNELIEEGLVRLINNNVQVRLDLNSDKR